MKGNRENKRSCTPFIAGMVTMVLLIGLISASFASNTDQASEQGGTGAVPSQASVSIFLTQKIAPGETLTTEQGGRAPKVLAYPDSKGETHYYIEAAAAAELFDVSDGVTFDKEKNQVEFSSVPQHAQRQDFKLMEVYDEQGNGIWCGNEVSALSGGVIVRNGGGPRTQTLEFKQKEWDSRRESLEKKPEYGKALGMYTEVDPAEMNLAAFSGRSMNGCEFKHNEKISQLFCFTSLLGKYAAITIENTGTSDAEINVHRCRTVGGLYDAFTPILLPAGQKITRAFKIDESKPLENQLQLVGQALGESGVSLKLTAEQYRSGN